MEIDMAVVANASTYHYQFQQAKHTRNGGAKYLKDVRESRG